MKNKFQRTVSAVSLSLALCLTGLTYAQQNQSTSAASQTEESKLALYKTSPVWKDMMEDPNANFFEVQKAFQLFWDGKEMPLEEDEIIGEKRRLKNNFLNRTFYARELKEQILCESLAFDCKKYRWWLIKTEPYIHDDGSIMSSEEKLELWKRHYEELNENK